MHDQSLLLNHEALGVLLSHPCISGSQELLARLLMTCKALNDAIAEELLGTVPIRHCILSASNLSNTAGLADWIATRGHILSACELYLGSEGGYHSLSAPLVERALAFGFKAAADSPQGLHLQSYAHHFATASVRHILAQCPAQHLQHLHLCWDDEQPYAAPVVPALAALTALTSLALSNPKAEQLMPAVSHLTRLQDLFLASVSDVRCLDQLPVSVVDLELSVKYRYPEWSPSQAPLVNLGYLTNCTSLTGSGLPVPLSRADDSLPPNLRQLRAELFSNAASEVLLGLTSLTALTLLEPQVDRKECWEKVTASLTQLHHVEVCFAETIEPAFTTHGWGGLPIKAMTIQMPHGSTELLVQAATVSAFTQLASSLTGLRLSGASASELCTVEATPRRLAAVLSKLTGLERLTLTHLEMEEIIEDDDITHDDHMDHTHLIEAIASLPCLSALGLSLLHETRPDTGKRHAVAGLAALGTRLTALSLPRYGLDDFAVTALACALINLRSLDLSENRHLSDATLPVIGAQLSALTALHLVKTAVTDSGLEYLARLPVLQELHVPAGVSCDALASRIAKQGGVRHVNIVGCGH